MSGHTDLIDRYLDGSATAEEVSRLDALLRTDPAVGQAFVAATRLDADMHFVSRDLARSLTADASGPNPVAAMPRRRPAVLPVRSWLLAAAALLMLGAVLLSLPLFSGGQPTAIAAVGATIDGATLDPGTRIRTGSIATSGNGSVDLRWPDGTRTELGGGGRVVIAGGQPMVLERGSLHCTVAAQSPGERFSIRTPHTTATVVGTRFMLSAGDATTRLTVSEGLVRFATASASLDVAAGGEAEAGADGSLGFIVPPATPVPDGPGRLEPGSGRPFRAGSPWNTVIPPGPGLDPASAAMVRRLQTATPDSNDGAVLALYRHAIPVYEATSATPSRQVVSASKRAPQAGAVIRVPVGAMPNAGSGALMVVDWVERRTWEFWRFAWDGEAIRCDGVGQIQLDGDGTGQTATGNAGASYLAGLIREREIAAGRIPHALAFGSSCAGRDFRFPAGKSDGSEGGPGSLPVGARIQLDPALDVDAVPGITPGERAIARALQEYGAYCVGRSGPRLLFFCELARDAGGDQHPGAVYAAAGLDRDKFAMPHIPWDALRVLR